MRKGEPLYSLPIGIYICTETMKTSIEDPQKTNNRTFI